MSREGGAIGEPLQLLGSGREGFTTRPVIAGRRGVVTAGHYLAATAGMQILQAGGNAIDAGVAMGFCLAVLEPHLNGIAGESPMLIHHAASGRTVAVSGQGTAPAAATIQWFQDQGIPLIPGDGLLPATVPSQVDNWLTALGGFGTLPLEPVLRPAIELAELGFPMYHGLRRCIVANEQRYREEWPGSAAVYLPDGRIPDWGDNFRNPEWAATFQGLIRAEKDAAPRGRAAGLEAARRAFYEGPVAERIAEFARDSRFRDATGRSHGGLLAYDDLVNFAARIEDAPSVNYRGLDVYKCGPWCQGPVFLQQLTLLEGYDLREMGHNSPDYVHTWVECAKLAFADREFYYGDPAFVNVPMDRLLSKEYAAQRRGLVDPEQASLRLRPGDAGERPLKLILGDERAYAGDTTHLDAVDAQGNMIAATPSGGWIPSSPVIPGLGFPLGTRGQMFSLDPTHPNCLQPGKRPRTTLTPSLATRDGEPCLAFGSPGGDQQDQWTLHFLMNHLHFGMNLQAAIEAPEWQCAHIPDSFYPRSYTPAGVVMEDRVAPEVVAELRRRGHRIALVGPWENGRHIAVGRDPETGIVGAAASPRSGTAYAVAR
ncbi:MAG: gamma-glutamyltransferase family protein [Armatimonadetes bacterium]|nr:gamma-glutamyltransferase family protein [Armatimonadota bacterium]